VPHYRQPAAGSFACHHLATTDPDAAAAFYGTLFGWTVREIRAAGSLGATTFRSGDADVATSGPRLAATTLACWLPCLAVCDVESTAADAERLGAALERPAAGSSGTPVVVADPAGARFGITRDHPGRVPGGDAAAPGRFCWTELRTDDPDGATAFYHALAGWTGVERHHRGEGRYWVFLHGGREVAGMVQEPNARPPSCWVPYVQVVSAEDTAELAQDLGGTLVTPPGDVPGRGRYAVFRDPGGALVAVFALTDAA
jgi:predicted enzyme related to lactoylglutathione lyase